MKEHIVIKYRHILLFYLFATLVPWAFWFAASYVICKLCAMAISLLFGYSPSQFVVTGHYTFTSGVFPFVILMNWLYYKTNRNILVAIIFHIMAGIFYLLFCHSKRLLYLCHGFDSSCRFPSPPKLGGWGSEQLKR